jgi:hypothetical protein
MKADKTKKITFIVLLIIAVIIWSRNFNIFKSETDFYKLKPTISEKKPAITKGMAQIEYVKPKLNPFSLPRRQEEPQKTKSKPVQEVQQAPEFVSGKYRIDGIVIEPEYSQVILMGDNNIRQIISLNDTIDGWTVKNISSDQIIFSQDKYRDTLFLETMLDSKVDD